MHARLHLFVVAVVLGVRPSGAATGECHKYLDNVHSFTTTCSTYDNCIVLPPATTDGNYARCTYKTNICTSTGTAPTCITGTPTNPNCAFGGTAQGSCRDTCSHMRTAADCQDTSFGDFKTNALAKTYFSVANLGGSTTIAAANRCKWTKWSDLTSDFNALKTINSAVNGNRGFCSSQNGQGGGSAAPTNTCTCTNGAKAEGAACTASGPKCVSCKMGYKLWADNTCQQCAAGTSQSNDAYKLGTCAQCLAGTYSANPGSALCAPCPGLQYQNDLGKTSCKDHRVCDPALTSLTDLSRGVKNTAGTAIKDATCTATDCAKLKIAHDIDCKTTTGGLRKCKANAVIDAKCNAIKGHYRTSPSKCACPASSRI